MLTRQELIATVTSYIHRKKITPVSVCASYHCQTSNIYHEPGIGYAEACMIFLASLFISHWCSSMKLRVDLRLTGKMH